MHIKELFEMAREGTLPADFKDWGLANKYGWTIANEADNYGNLPDYYNPLEDYSNYRQHLIDRYWKNRGMY